MKPSMVDLKQASCKSSSVSSAPLIAGHAQLDLVRQECGALMPSVSVVLWCSQEASVGMDCLIALRGHRRVVIFMDVPQQCLMSTS